MARPRGWPSSTTSGCTAWPRARRCNIGEYCYEWLAAMKGRFALRENPRINYAYHFDAALVRALPAQARPSRKGVKRVEGKIKQVRTHQQTASSNRSSCKTARSSRAISSSTAPAFAACSSKARCRPASRTGLTGCPATAPWRSRPSSTSRPSRTRRATRTGRLALEHPRAASRRQWRGVLQQATCRMTRRAIARHGLRRQAGQGSLARSASRPGGARRPGTRTWWRSVWRAASSSRSSPPAST